MSRLAPLYAAYAHEDHIEGSVRSLLALRHILAARGILSIEAANRVALILRLLLDQPTVASLAVYARAFDACR